MSTVHQWVLASGEQGEDTAPYEGSGMYESYIEAKEDAMRYGMAVVEYEYEYSDNYIVDDYRPTRAKVEP